MRLTQLLPGQQHRQSCNAYICRQAQCIEAPTHLQGLLPLPTPGQFDGYRTVIDTAKAQMMAARTWIDLQPRRIQCVQRTGAGTHRRGTVGSRMRHAHSAAPLTPFHHITRQILYAPGRGGVRMCTTALGGIAIRILVGPGLVGVVITPRIEMTAQPARHGLPLLRPGQPTPQGLTVGACAFKVHTAGRRIEPPGHTVAP